MIIHEIKIGDDVVGKAYVGTGTLEDTEVWIPKALIARVLNCDPASISITE